MNSQKQWHSEDFLLDFLFDRLRADEEDAFLDYLETDVELKESVEGIQELCIQEKWSEDDLKAFLNCLEFPLKSIPSKPTKTVSLAHRIGPALAAAAVVLLAVILIWPTPPAPSADYPEIRPENKYIAAAKGDLATMPADAVALYDSGEFSKFLDYPFDSTLYIAPDARFYMGLAWLQLKTPNPSKALKELEFAYQNGTSFRSDILFYLAQTHLLQGNRARCTIFIEELNRMAPDYPGLDKLSEVCAKN